MEKQGDGSGGKVVLRKAESNRHGLVGRSSRRFMRSGQVVVFGIDWGWLWRTKSVGTSDELGLIGDG